MTRIKHLVRSRKAFHPQFDRLEERAYPGQTVTGLATFASGPETMIWDSERNITIGGAKRRRPRRPILTW
jgi:hypothetical protein